MSGPPRPLAQGQPRNALLGCVLVLVGMAVVIVLLIVGDRLFRTSGIEARVVHLQTPALVGAAIAALLWIGGLGLVRLARSPADPKAWPPTSDLGPEPPAIVDMLTNDFQVEREAIPATLLDLGARRFVDLEGIGPELQVRLRDRPDEGSLLPYERRVLELVRSRAVDGVVPAGALTSGRRPLAQAWWKSFRNEVVDDAQGRGLSRDLWDRRVLGLATLAASVPAGLVFLGTRNWGAPVAFMIGALTVIGYVRQGRRQRDTEEGLRVAGRWLGVGRHLRDDPAFQDLPPAAVAVWERYLGYAAALGAARGVVREIPMGADEDRRAWSAYGGQWRLVRIRYPNLWPPGWGWRPWAALLVSVAVGIVATALLTLVFNIGWPRAGPSDPEGLITAIRILVLVMLGSGLFAATWAISVLVRSAMDLGSSQEITGLVLRMRRFGGSRNSRPRQYVAVDDGRSPTIRAFRVVRPEVQARSGLSEYVEAIATVTARLRHVRALRQR
jgi:hypothetical protein